MSPILFVQHFPAPPTCGLLVKSYFIYLVAFPNRHKTSKFHSIWLKVAKVIQFLSFDEAIASRAVFVIKSGADGRSGANAFGAR